jgi:hypothetical protein
MNRRHFVGTMFAGGAWWLIPKKAEGRPVHLEDQGLLPFPADASNVFQDALEFSPGQYSIVPPGRYLVHKKILLARGVRIEGETPETTVILTDNGQWTTTENTSDVVVRHLTFDASQTNRPYALQVAGGHRIHYSDLRIIAAPEYGLHIQRTGQVWVERCVFFSGPRHFNDHIGITGGGGSVEDVWIKQCFFYPAPESGIDLEPAAGDTVARVFSRDCRFNGSRVAVQAVAKGGTHHEIEVTGNYIHSADVGIWIGTGFTARVRDNRVVNSPEPYRFTGRVFDSGNF